MNQTGAFDGSSASYGWSTSLIGIYVDTTVSFLFSGQILFLPPQEARSSAWIWSRTLKSQYWLVFSTHSGCGSWKSFALFPMHIICWIQLETISWLLSALCLIQPLAIYNELMSCYGYWQNYLQSKLSSGSVWELKDYINGTIPSPSSWAHAGYTLCQ